MYRIIIVFIVAMSVVTSPYVRAEDQTSLLLTDAQVQQIKNHCVSVQATLSRLRANDGLRRVNLGQQYETISSKLMAPLNSRIALAKADGIELSRTAIDFNRELDVFRSNYKAYEQTMTNIITIQCAQEPVRFYDGVIVARNQRADVRSSIDSLNLLLVKFGEQFEAFKLAQAGAR